MIAQAAGLKANGVDVKILTSSEACAREATARDLPYDFARPWHSGIDPLFSPRIWQSGRYRNGVLPAAVVHNNARTWFAGGLLFPRALHAQVLHRENVHTYRFFRNWIALSSGYADELRDSPSGRFRRIALAPNGLAAVPKQLSRRMPAGPFTIGTAGRPSETKGTEMLLAAALRVRQVRPDIRFKIAGRGYDQFQEMAKRIGVADVVEFVGWQDDMDGFLDTLDAFCLPSVGESFGLVLIEAMARGLPIISTATNGARDIVKPGETGWLVPINDPEAFAAAVLDAGSDRAEISRRSAAAYRDACQRYAPVAAGRNLLDALASLREMPACARRAKLATLATPQD
ncbi:MAG: glycosyltransferase family 4 protein [Boseongicola sp.]